MTTHDARFDGCFFIGVTSTGVYCRPVCRVKMPRRENCRFFSTAAAAEASGYRPCLRCRPELAPGNASVDNGQRIATRAAALIEDGLQDGAGLDALAAQLGVTSRHLRRVFQSEFGVSPIEYSQTQRLLLAKRLLTDTALPVTEIALASGFQSLRRLEALFRSRYRLSPRDLRNSPGKPSHQDFLHFEMSYRPPYDWDALATFLAARSIAGVEAADSTSYRRIVRIAHAGSDHTGWIEVRPDARRPVLNVALAPSLARAMPAVLARVRHLFDLSCHPALIGDALGPLAADRPGLRVPGAFDGFEIAVRAVLGQQVSVAAARTLAGRFAAAFGTPVESPFDGLRTAFPTAVVVAQTHVDDLARLGVLPSRSRTIVELAKALASGGISLVPGVAPEETMEKLRRIEGIGEWTAQYIAMRALAWPDAFPHSDLGVMKALGEKRPKRVLELGEAWRPWRSYAVMHLWMGGNSNGTAR